MTASSNVSSVTTACCANSSENNGYQPFSAKAQIVVASDARGAIQSESDEAAVVLLGFKPPAEGEEARFLADMEHIAGALPRVIYVHNAGGMELDS